MTCPSLCLLSAVVSAGAGSDQRRAGCDTADRQPPAAEGAASGRCPGRLLPWSSAEAGLCEAAVGGSEGAKITSIIRFMQ